MSAEGRYPCDKTEGYEEISDQELVLSELVLSVRAGWVYWEVLLAVERAESDIRSFPYRIFIALCDKHCACGWALNPANIPVFRKPPPADAY